MEYSKIDFLKDFATRTLANLKKIDECVSNGEPLYEVTQLVNSFIGLLIFPQQVGDKLIEDDYVDEDTFKLLQKAVLNNTYTNERQDQNLKNIIYHMRNAVAHGSIEFEPQTNLNGCMEINSIKFIDRLREQEFEIKIDILTIRRFLDSFSRRFLSVINDE